MATTRTAKSIPSLRAKPGHHGFGGGLYLQVTPTGTASWVFRYRRHGRLSEFGLGSESIVTLAEAATKALDARRMLLDSVDPIVARRQARQAARLADAKRITFSDAVRQHRDEVLKGRNAKTLRGWTNTLRDYAEPVLGRLAVADIDGPLVYRVLEPIWTAKPETAVRVRGRIETVLDWAAAKGYRAGPNPARLEGNLKHLLPERDQRVTHHAALPHRDIGAFMIELRKQQGTSAKALEFLILTVCRTSEVLGAKWAEIDITGRMWRIPASRMKAKAEHVVPLSDAAVRLLKALPRHGDYVFPGAKPGATLSNMSMLSVLKRMNCNSATAHGFRSTFRDWCAEHDVPDAIAEACLAHKVSDAVVAAYRRTTFDERRKRVMQQWSDYVSAAPIKADGTVVSLRG